MAECSLGKALPGIYEAAGEGSGAVRRKKIQHPRTIADTQRDATALQRQKTASPAGFAPAAWIPALPDWKRCSSAVRESQSTDATIGLKTSSDIAVAGAAADCGKFPLRPVSPALTAEADRGGKAIWAAPRC